MLLRCMNLQETNQVQLVGVSSARLSNPTIHRKCESLRKLTQLLFLLEDDGTEFVFGHCIPFS